MLFSEYFGVDKQLLDEYGAVDISLVCDLPLFIDPMLIYLNKNPEIKKHYQDIETYLQILLKKASCNLNQIQINNFFSFKERGNNWFGVCKNGNRGNALGKKFASEFYSQISTICDNNDISNNIHLEKMFLVQKYVGRDKISDMTTNIILSYLVSYTENFARKYIDPSKCATFEVPKAKFDEKLEIFIEIEGYLPYIENNNKREYVLLTPKSILRTGNPEICFENMLSSFDTVKDSITDEDLKIRVNSLFQSIINEYYLNKARKLQTVDKGEIKEAKKNGVLKTIDSFQVLYDYFIKLKEDNLIDITEKAMDELTYLLKTSVDNKLLETDLFGYKKTLNEKLTAKEEAIERLNYLKDYIENGDCWKELYINKAPIIYEENIQRLFYLVWARTNYKLCKEANNGPGPVDFNISFGKKNQCVVEFKLAKNLHIEKAFEQIERYAISHQTKDKILVIFSFGSDELGKCMNAKKLEKQKNTDVLIVDCDYRSKKSASK